MSDKTIEITFYVKIYVVLFFLLSIYSINDNVAEINENLKKTPCLAVEQKGEK